jgi:hypothetical protein
VPLAIVTEAAVTPEPEMMIFAGEAKLVPVSVTGTLVPGAPEEGLMEVKVGVREVTVNVRARVVWLFPVTVTL